MNKFYLYNPSNNTVSLEESNVDLSKTKGTGLYFQGLYEGLPVYSTENKPQTATIKQYVGGLTVEEKPTENFGEVVTITTQAPITETRYYDESGKEVPAPRPGVKYEQMKEIIKTPVEVKIKDLSQGYNRTIDWKTERFMGEYKSTPNKYLAVKVNNLTLVQEPGEPGSDFSERVESAIATQGQGVQGGYGVIQPRESQELKGGFSFSTNVPKKELFLFERPSAMVLQAGGTPAAQGFLETFENIGESYASIGSQPGAYNLSPSLIKLHQGKDDVTLFNPLKPSYIGTSVEQGERASGAFGAYASMIVYPSLPKWARMQEESLVGMTVQSKQLKPGIYEQRIITKGTSEFGTELKGVSVQQIKTGDSGVSWVREFGTYGDKSNIGLGLNYDFSKGSLWKNEYSITVQPSNKEVMDFFYTKGLGTSNEKLNLFGGSGTFGKITSTGLERTGSYGYFGRNVDDFSGLFKTNKEVSGGNVLSVQSQGFNLKQLQVESFTSRVLSKATQDVASLSQSELLTKSVTGVASKTGSILAASTIVKPKTRVTSSILTPSTLIKQKSDVKISLLPVEKQKIFSKSSLVQAQKQESRTRSGLASTMQLTKQEQKTSQALMTSTATTTSQSILTQTVTTPFTSSPTVIITTSGGGGFGGMPFFSAGGGGGVLRRSYFKRSPRAKKYQPSFRSALMGIKGKAGSASKLYTGHEARPIPESKRDSFFKKSKLKLKSSLFKSKKKGR